MKPVRSRSVARFLRAASRPVFVALLGFLLSAAALSAQTTGTIVGRVLNVTSERFIKNAQVQLVGTDLETVTDDTGDFVLPKVPYRWWHDRAAGDLAGDLFVRDAARPDAAVTVPADARPRQTLHLACEVTDRGVPPLTRYRRVIVTVVP